MVKALQEEHDVRIDIARRVKGKGDNNNADKDKEGALASMAIRGAPDKVSTVVQTLKSLKLTTMSFDVSAKGVIPAIIGKRGATIQHIQEQSKADIQLDKGTGTLTIEGTVEQVACAQKLVEAIVDENTEHEAHFDMPTSRISYAVGKSGSKIRALQEKHRVYINIPREEKGVETKDETSLEIRGTKSAIEGAKEDLALLMQQYEREHVNMSVAPQAASLLIGPKGATVSQHAARK